MPVQYEYSVRTPGCLGTRLWVGECWTRSPVRENSIQSGLNLDRKRRPGRWSGVTFSERNRPCMGRTGRISVCATYGNR